MDRCAFLSGLPFVLPTCLSSWPRSEDRSIEVLLKETFHLSIEPHSSKGPAFFAAGKDDPTMTPVELALDYSRDVDRSRRSTNKTSPNLLLERSSSHDYYSSLSLLARIDGRIYALDVRHLQGLQLQEGTSSRPASLLLTFPSCCFRIFSNYDFDDNVLEQAQRRLTTLVQTHPVDVWGRGLLLDQASVVDSPSTAASSHCQNREGQSSSSSTMADPHALEDGNRKRPRDSVTGDGDVVPETPAFAVRLERRRGLHRECKDCVEQIQHVLLKVQTPRQSEASPASSHNNEDRDHALGSLLTTAAELQGRSYVSPHDVGMATQHWEQVAQEKQTQVQALLAAFFPAPRSSKRSDKRQPTSDDAACWSGEEQVAKFLEERKTAVEERVKLFLLPSRG
jgi:hypothetical protein